VEIEWLQDELLTGFQKLYCLGLERTPAAEILPGTAKVWVETLSERFDWNQNRDTDRIRRSFVILAGTRLQWPLPQHFMDAMPDPDAQPRIERKPDIPESREARMRRLEDLGIMQKVGKMAAAEQGQSS
jgi:hypothetical protein